MPAIECTICGEPSSVLIGCPTCDGTHCQSCVDSPLHKCRKPEDKIAELVANGYEPLGRNTFIPITRRSCTCGQFFEGQFDSSDDAADAIVVWSELHAGKGHKITEAP